jgi:outer membrane protein insertion porin family
MPTYTYNTTNHPYEPTRGKYFYAALGLSGGVLGGNVNSIRPVVETRYYTPIAKKKAERPHVLAMRFLGSMVTGYGGRVPPPFSRFYIGGEEDIRGYYIRSISPLAWYPTVSQVCNKDALGNDIPALGSDGKSLNTCGSYTRYPVSTVIYPGGDTMLVGNIEYRIPIAGPVTVAYFTDIGTNFIWRESQLKVQKAALASFATQFPGYPIPEYLVPVPETNRRLRASIGIEVQVVLPMVNMPVRIFYGYNILRVNETLESPPIYPDEGLFPNQATYDAAIRQGFRSLGLSDKKSRVGFTVTRTF